MDRGQEAYDRYVQESDGMNEFSELALLALDRIYQVVLRIADKLDALPDR